MLLYQPNGSQIGASIQNFPQTKFLIEYPARPIAGVETVVLCYGLVATGQLSVSDTCTCAQVQV